MRACRLCNVFNEHCSLMGPFGGRKREPQNRLFPDAELWIGVALETAEVP